MTRRTSGQVVLGALAAILAIDAPVRAEENTWTGWPRLGQDLVDPTEEHDNPDSALRCTGIHLYWENDGAYVKPYNHSDRHYTNGFKIEASLNRWPEAVYEQLPTPWYEVQRTGASVYLAQHMYTGKRIERSMPRPNAHPHAGWLYFGAVAQRAGAHWFEHFELAAGIVGPASGAEALQKAVHTAFAQQRPNGWGDQLDNEPTVQLTYQTRYRTPRVQFGAFGAEAIPQAGFTLGNAHMNANLGITGRIGINLPNDFGPARLLEFRDHSAQWNSDNSLYVYGRLGGRAVARNMFLEGNAFADGPGVDAFPLVGELQLGVVFRIKHIEFGYAATFLTREFRGQQNDDSFGAMTLTARWTF